MSKEKVQITPVAGIALMLAASIVQAAPIWQNDWLISSPVTLQEAISGTQGSKPSQTIAFGADQERVIAAPSPNAPQYQIVRLRSNGSARWSASIHEYDRRAQAYALQALSDGGALVALGYPGSESISDVILRYSADGGLAWSRMMPTGWLARVSPTRSASAGCSRLTVFDDADGQVAWQRVLGGSESCGVGGLASDAEGNLYTSIERKANFTLIGYRIVAFDAQGTQRWRVESNDATGGDVIGVAGELLLVRGSSELRAMRLSDGSVAWSAPIAGQVRILVSRDGTDDALVIGGGAVQRLASDTGLPRWSIAWADGAASADFVGDGLVLAQLDGSRARIDIADGSIAWNVSGGGVRWFAFGDLESGTLQGLAQPHDPGPGAPPAVLHAIDAATGQIVASTELPSVAQGFDVADSLTGDGDVVNSGVSQHADFPRFHLRRVDGMSGATTWEHEEPIDEFGSGYRFMLPRAAVVARGAQIFASMAITGGLDCDAAGWARVASYRLSDGGREWIATLRDTNQRCTRVSPPAADAAGNVFVSVAAIVPCGDGTVMGCQRRTLYKLAAADGSVAWRMDEDFDAGSGGFVMMPKPLYVIGTDVIVPGEFVGSTATSRRHAGTDGSILWSSSAFTSPMQVVESIDVLDDHRLVVHANDWATNTVGWAALDADDGTTLWSSEAPAPEDCVPVPSCSLGLGADSRVSPEGDLLDPFQLDYAPWLARWHYDGNGGIDRWIAAPGSPITSSAIGWLAPDTAHATLFRRHRGAGGSMQLLAGLDASTGQLHAQRALYGYHLGFLEYHATRRPLSIPAANRLLATTHTVLPARPVAHGVALLDTAITASGNLSIDVGVNTDHVAPGDAVGFDVHVGYQGDNPIEDAGLLLRLPWGGGVRDVICETIGVASCTLDLRDGQINATVDLAPGGGVTVHGEIDVLAAGETLATTAMVTGPLGLAEIDTLDNFARIEILQSLFRSGFEAAD